MSSFGSVTRKVINQGKQSLKPVLRPMAQRVQPLVDKAAGKPQGSSAEPKSSKSASTATAKATAAAYIQIAKKVSPSYSEKPDGLTTAPSRQEQNRNLKNVRRLQSESQIFDGLVAGRGLSESVIDSVREMLAAGETSRVTSMAYRLKAEHADSQLDQFVLGMLLLSTSSTENAWAEFSKTSDPVLRAAAATEYYSAAVSEIGAQMQPTLMSDIENGHVQSWTDKSILKVAQFAFTAGLNDEVRQLIEHGLGRPSDRMSNDVAAELRRLSLWLPKGPKRSLPSMSGKTRPFGIIGYDQPSARSRNVGDYIQTLASIGHLARQTDIEVTGDSDIVKFFDDVRKHVKPERVIGGNRGKLELFELERDANVYQDLPDESWAVVFGWFMHETFGKKFNIPFHENLRPILISVYIRHPEMLTPEAIDYLKKYAPVGCRDWQSVALLRSVGVPAFFSGCMTTTVDTLFPEPQPDTRRGTIRIDWKGGGSGPSRTQAFNEVRDLSLVDNLKLAKEWVDSYAYDYSEVFTSRLHAYLPARSVGAKVKFVPGNKSDWRFGGLIDIDDTAYEAIRQGILDKLGVIIPLIADGADEETIYRTWREITADDMARADEYLSQAALPVASSSRINTALSQVKVDVPTDSDSVAIFIDAKQGEFDLLPQLVESIDRNAGNRFTIFGWAPAFEGHMSNGVFKDLKNGSIQLIRPVSRTKPHADEVKALLPALLETVDRLIVVPAAARVDDDLTKLSATEIAASDLLAAKDDDRGARTNGLTLLRTFARRLRDEHSKSLQFLFASQKRQFRPFSADVMVLDGEKARRDELPAATLGVMDEYGYNYEDAMQIVVAHARTPLSRQWNARPQFEAVDEAALLNWRGQPKPGGRQYAPLADATARS